MRFIVCAIYLIIIMPITSTGWAEGSNILLEPNTVCKKSRQLPAKIADICKNETSLLKEITRGISKGFRECETQFKNRRWNCSTQKKSMRKILARDSRETAFVNAITSAGIAFSVTKACSQGELVECSCDKNHVTRNQNKKIKPNNQNGHNNSHHNNKRNNNLNLNHNRNNEVRKKSRGGGKGHNKKLAQENAALNPGSWEWSGCDDNVFFGHRKSRDFLDARLGKRRDIKALVRLHNNEAGRLAVKKSMRLECKCHGLSGSCTMKTCWMRLPTFADVAQRLKDRFDGASKVIASNDGNGFIPEGKTIKPPSRQDLVYTDESPDFCKPNFKTGSMGTQGRECNITSEGVDGCDLLCCSRGYQRNFSTVKSNCKCRFYWCCEVVCSTCYERREIYTCK